MRSAILFLLPLAFAETVSADCASKQERLAWARERMYPTATVDQLKHVRDGLQMATKSDCSDVGDFWYYLSLVQAKLNGKPDPLVMKRLGEYPASEDSRRLNPLETAAAVAKQHPL